MRTASMLCLLFCTATCADEPDKPEAVRADRPTEFRTNSGAYLLILKRKK